MKRGDLMLYKSTGRWYERLIVYATRSPFVHVAIVYNEHYTLGAYPKGIALVSTPKEDSQHVLIPIDAHLNIEAGMDWASLQVGRKYGWSDIVYQGIKFLAPNNPWQFGRRGEWDCSDYVTRYLQHIGYDIPDGFEDPYSNTPADIARMFNLLPPRKLVKV